MEMEMVVKKNKLYLKALVHDKKVVLIRIQLQYNFIFLYFTSHDYDVT